MAAPKFITFDAYGTLIDFDLESAALEAIEDRMQGVDRDAFLKDYEEIRYQEVLGEYKPYRQVLRDSLRKAMTQYGMEYREEDGQAVIDAVPTFGPFPDVPPVLKQLRQHSKLVIISNTEDDLIAHNVEKIGVPIDYVITAEQARAYKPSHAAFEYMFEVLRCDRSEILHVAQGFNYDIMPASELGLKRVWINRRGQPGDQERYGPYDELPDLTGLPALIGV